MVLVIGILAASVAAASSGQMPMDGPAAASDSFQADVAEQPQGGVEFFTDETAFDAALGIPLSLTVETFDGGHPVGPYPTGCTAPLSSASDDGCFSPGQLVAGFSLSPSPSGALTIFPTRFLGPAQTSRAIGASTFASSTAVSFSPAASAVALQVFGGTIAGIPVDVEVFDESGNSLGTTVVAGNSARDASVFFGVISATPIGTVALNAQSTSSGELINRLQFRPAGAVAPGLMKSFSPSGVAANVPSTLTITLGNQGQTGIATLSADLTDNLPAGLVVAPTPNASTTCAGGLVTANAGSASVTLGSGALIPGAGTCTVSVDVWAPNAGLYANTIPAGALQTDLGSNRDAADATLTVSSGQHDTFPSSENFDEVFAPQLPNGWVTSTTTGAGDWTTSTTTWDSAPNSAYAPDAGSISDVTLDSPVFVPVAGQEVTFRHRFNLERRFDGAVLEISIDGGEFADIVDAGGTFVTGGYAGVLISSLVGNPIGGRPAWTGNSFEFVTTTATLPAAAIGHSTRLRFRTASDGGNLNTGEVRGWWIDSIVLGISAQAPIAAVTPASLTFAVNADATASDTLNIANAMGSDPLTFMVQSRATASHAVLTPYADDAASVAQAGKTLVTRPPATLALRDVGDSRQAASDPWAPEGSLLFQLDDGSAEASEGTGTGSLNPPVTFTEQAAVWINRFSASDALLIHSVSVFWPEPDMGGGDLLGLQANLVVYYDADADGDPTNAVRVGADDFVPISVTGNFQTYQTDFSVPAAGDVYIGFVDQWALAGGFTPRLYPASVDVDNDSPQMSYYSSVDTPPVDVDHLGNNTYTESFTNANLMIRAAATGGGDGGPCSGPIVNWLTAAPSSGSIDGGSDTDVTVTVDPAAGSLAAGTYTADLCITTNDPTQSLIAVPVSVTVATAPPASCYGGADEIFCDGFDDSQGTGSIGSGSIEASVVANSVTADDVSERIHAVNEVHHRAGANPADWRAPD